MNERIRQLAQQSGFDINSNNSNTFNGHILPKSLESFAFNIIKECGMLGDHWVNNEDNGKNRISDRLKEHFGIEETVVEWDHYTDLPATSSYASKSSCA
jgi:hypothetical protein